MRSPSSLTSSSKPAANDNKDGGKKKMECCSKVGLKRGPWTAEEDELLSEYIKREGEGRWRTLPKKAGLLRCGKSCRLRWMNYLRPSVKRGLISPDEEDLILRLHRLLGNRWSLIAGRIPGRTDNEIKNYWNTHLSKKLISQGIDPKTHKPMPPLLIPNINPLEPNNTTNTNKYHDQFHHHHEYSLNSTEYSKLLARPCSSSSTHDYNYAVPLYHDHQNPTITGNIFQNVPYSSHHDHEDGSKMKLDSDHLNITSTNCSSTIDDDVDQGNGTAGDDDQGMNMHCCTDEAFSSFLNSLINDDMFNINHNHHQQQLQDQLQEANLVTNSNSNYDPNLKAFSGVDDHHLACKRFD